MHHSSISNFPKLFSDTHGPGLLPAVTPDIVARSKMDGGEDIIAGYHPKQRARILHNGIAPEDLGPDDPYLPDGVRHAAPPAKAADSDDATRASDEACPPPPKASMRASRKPKICLRGSTCSSFPAYRRQKVLFAGSFQGHQHSKEMCKDSW